jgi:hypothetical protein
MHRSLALSCLVASGLSAQAPVGKITGVVFDSLFSRAPLAEANVLVEGVPRAARTDVRGRFVIDSVPTGRYRVTFFHPSIDAIALQPVAAMVLVDANRTVAVQLATPAVQTFARALCGRPLSQGDALLLGVARAIGTNDAVPLRKVDAQWAEMEIHDGGILRSTPTVSARLTAGGGFYLCDTPIDAALTLSALTTDGRAAVTSLQPTGAAVVQRVLHVADYASRHGVLVVRADGAPIPGAVVTSVRDSAGARSDSTGLTASADAVARAGEVSVRALGYRPLRARVDSSARSIVLAPDALTAQELEAVTVQSERSLRELPPEFEERRRAGVGEFFTREQIAERNPIHLTHLLERVPGLLVGTNSRVLNQRGGFDGPCEPVYFIDGVRYTDETSELPPLLMTIPPATVAGLEIYRSVAHLPRQYAVTGAACGAILIWTRRGTR